ncbi:MAG: glycosyltransferase family 39 protein [Patescibacteria group bacterium]
MLKFFKKYKIEIILLVVSLLAHFFFFFLLLHNYGHNFPYDTNEDAAEFFTISKNIYFHGAFSSEPELIQYPNSLRTPLYPAYLAGFNIFTTSPLLPIILQNILAALAVVLVYRLGLLVVKNKTISWLAALLFALDPLANYWANITEPDTLLVVATLVVLVSFFKFRDSGQLKFLALTSLFLGLSILIKPVALYFPIFFVLMIIGDAFFKKQLPKGIKWSAIFLAITFLVVAPWLGRNYSRFGVFSVSSISGYNLYSYAAVVGPYPQEVKDYLVEVKEKYGQFGQNRNGERDLRAQKKFKALAVKIIMANPIVYAKAHVLGMARFFLDDGHKEIFYNRHYRAMLIYNTPEPTDKPDITGEFKKGNFGVIWTTIKTANCYTVIYFISKLIYFLAYLLILFGLITSGRRDKKMFGAFLFLLSLAFFIALAAGPYGPSVRYRLPVLPGLLLVMVYGFMSLKKIKNPTIK